MNRTKLIQWVTENTSTPDANVPLEKLITFINTFCIKDDNIVETSKAQAPNASAATAGSAAGAKTGCAGAGASGGTDAIYKIQKMHPPTHERCLAIKGNEYDEAKRCTRRRPDGSKFCGTHIRNPPAHFIVENLDLAADTPSMKSVNVRIQDIKGICLLYTSPSPRD